MAVKSKVSEFDQFLQIEQYFLETHDVERSTMMNTPCLRYQGKFIAMFFEKENALIVKLPAERVEKIIEMGGGTAFNFTKKQFK